MTRSKNEVKMDIRDAVYVNDFKRSPSLLAFA